MQQKTSFGKIYSGYARLVIRSILLFIGTSLLMMKANHYSIGAQTMNQIYSNTDSLPKADVGLLLGTMKRLETGSIFSFYQARIDGTVRLFQAGKIDTILISATLKNKYGENEVSEMKQDLLRLGVPEERMIIHEAGDRTFASLKHLSGSSKRFTVISQRLHLERALFIAKTMGINAQGFEVAGDYSFRLTFREEVSRLRMRWDLLFS